MITEKRRQNYFIPASIAYMAILAYLQLRNPERISPGITSVKQLLHNLAHIPAYAVLAWLLVKSFIKVNFRAKAYVIASASIYGILMEFLQSLNLPTFCVIREYLFEYNWDIYNFSNC